MSLSGRLAIIVGGFGGLGMATGQKLSSQGAKLALLYAPFEAPRIDEVKKTYADLGVDDIKTYECDITLPESVTKAFQEIAEDITADAAPSMLINSAGYVNLTKFVDTPPEDMIKHLHINVLGPMLCSQAFGRLYLAQKSEGKVPGRIVTIASQAAHIQLDDHHAYCASKAALLGLTKCMASEWGPEGITSNTVSPGPVWTEMGKKAWADKDAREAYQKSVPTGKFAEPEEIASAIAYFCSDAACNANGIDIRIDGGFCIR